jgi:hypothetical protein
MDSDEEEESVTNVTALTSTSQTLVLSETRRAAEGTSPQQNLETSTHATSPRAPSPKRVRIELGKEMSLVVGSSTTPLDDVSIFTTIFQLPSFSPFLFLF